MSDYLKKDLAAFYDNRPDWLQGYISFDDAHLLADMVGKKLSTPVLELGVASGWSSCVLLHLLAKEVPCDGTWLHSYDVLADCYFDRSRKTGSAVDEVVPELKQHWQFHIGNGSQVAKDHKDSPVEFAFIDADHRHPWASIDLVEFLPALRPDAWVAFHDVNLPNITDNKEWHVYGPKFLFDAWPWEKVLQEGTQHNIGAVKLPSDHMAVREFCAQVMKDKKWEADVDEERLARLGLPLKSSE